MTVYAQLTGLILPCGMNLMIGAERRKQIAQNIDLYFQPHQTPSLREAYPKGGSYRFVQLVDGLIVAGLQVMSMTGIGGRAANVYCLEPYRRRGYATNLSSAARRTLGDLDFSEDQSADGRLWVAALCPTS